MFSSEHPVTFSDFMRKRQIRQITADTVILTGVRTGVNDLKTWVKKDDTPNESILT